MAMFYHVLVQSIQENYLTCLVTKRNEEQFGLASSRTLALGFLWDTTEWDWWLNHAPGAQALEITEAEAQAHATPLGRELSEHDICEDDWLQANVDRFISCVGVVDRCECDYLWQGAEAPVKMPRATYHIAVTDARLIEHLAPGMEWESCVWDRDRQIQIVPEWRTSTVLQLAQGIYDDRTFDQLPILADALQDAGCDKDDILNHFRDPNATHVRGCWALDLVLGKE